MSFWIGQQVLILVFLGALLLIGLSNLFMLRDLGTYPMPRRWPRVSVLIPARDEERNIEACVRSLLAQDYPDYEVIVLDDDSQDGTATILARLERENRRLRVLRGRPLPPDWLGKHWACQQLYQAADGELLLFTDADTRHGPLTLRRGVAALEAQQADLLSALPREEVGTLAERLVVPMIPWSIFAFLPLAVAYRVRLPFLSSAIGQFMLFRHSALDKIGGYTCVRHDVVDDIEMSHQIKAHGLRWRLANAREDVTCRMYHSFAEVYQGFSKNMFASLGSNVLFFLIAWLWQGVVFIVPPVLLLAALFGAHIAPVSIGLAAAAVVMSLALWGLSHQRFGIPLPLALLYPLSMLTTLFIALRSMTLALSGRAAWKGRALARQRARLL